MSGDQGSRGRGVRRPRLVRRPAAGPGPLGELKELLYQLYLEAGAPTLEHIAALVAADDDLPGAPEKDTIARCLGSSDLPASQLDVVAIATVLARQAGWDPRDAAAGARGLWVRARMVRPVGTLIAELCDPFVLEVHRLIEVEDQPTDLPALTPYIPRAHDERLAQAVALAAAGHSVVAVLVGGSSTGKTRACWEAVSTLPDGWRLWHPFDPTRPEAALAGIERVGPRTVVWLDETQLYLDTAGSDMGERVAAALRTVIAAPERAPVLMLGTMWREYWDILTREAPPGAPDPYSQARELLAGRDITVADAFTAGELISGQAVSASDPRLRRAVADAEDGRIAQYLAGVPVLLARYRNAPVSARALIHAAMDARRLGFGIALPLPFLAAAAPGYMNDVDWSQAGERWLEQALAYAVAPCSGVRGPLTLIRPRRTDRAESEEAAPMSGREAVEPHYRLADYLDQIGTRVRADQLPPATFWDAAVARADADASFLLGQNAYSRGLYRHAAQLWKNAVGHSVSAGSRLFEVIDMIDPSAIGQASCWIADCVPVDDPCSVVDVMEQLREKGLVEASTSLAARIARTADTRDPEIDRWNYVDKRLEALRQVDAAAAAVFAERQARDCPFHDPRVVAHCLESLRKVGAHGAVATLLARNPAHTVSLDHPGHVAELLAELANLREPVHIAALISRIPDCSVSFDRPEGVAELLLALKRFEKLGARNAIDALLARDPARNVRLDPDYRPLYLAVLALAHALKSTGGQDMIDTLMDRAAITVVPNPSDVQLMLSRLRRWGVASQAAAVLSDRAARTGAVDSPSGVTELLEELHDMGASQAAAVLADRAARTIPIDRPGRALWLRESLRSTGAHEAAAVLTDRMLNHPQAAAWLLDTLREEGAEDALTATAGHIARNFPLSDPSDLCVVLGSLRRNGQEEAVETLLARDPASAVTLDHPGRLSDFINWLFQEKKHHALARLLARDPARSVAISDPSAVALLLQRLRHAGESEALAALLARDPASAVTLNHPDQVAQLVEVLRTMDPQNGLRTLIARDPAGSVILENYDWVSWLMKALMKASAHQNATALAIRAADSGMFTLLLKIRSYPYGREPDRSPSPQWGWMDLGKPGRDWRP